MTSSLQNQAGLPNGRSILYEAYSNPEQFARLDKAIKGYQRLDKKNYAEALRSKGISSDSKEPEALKAKLELIRPIIETLVKTGISKEEEKVQLVSNYLISKFEKGTHKLNELLDKIATSRFLKPEAKETKKKEKEFKIAEEQKALKEAGEKKREEELYKQTPEYKIETIQEEIGKLAEDRSEILQKHLTNLKKLLISRHALGEIRDRLINAIEVRDQASAQREKLATILGMLVENDLEGLLEKYDASLMHNETLQNLILERDGVHYFSVQDVVEIESCPKELQELIKNARDDLNPIQKQLDEKSKELESLLPEPPSKSEVEIGPEVPPAKSENNHESLLDDPRNYDELFDEIPQLSRRGNDDLARAIAMSLESEVLEPQQDLDFAKAVKASLEVGIPSEVQEPKSFNVPAPEIKFAAQPEQNVKETEDLVTASKPIVGQVVKQVKHEVKPLVSKAVDLAKPENVVKATKEANTVAQEKALNQNDQVVQYQNEQKKKVSLFKRFCNALLKPFKAIAAFFKSFRKKYLPF